MNPINIYLSKRNAFVVKEAESENMNTTDLSNNVKFIILTNQSRYQSAFFGIFILDCSLTRKFQLLGISLEICKKESAILDEHGVDLSTASKKIAENLLTYEEDICVIIIQFVKLLEPKSLQS